MKLNNYYNTYKAHKNYEKALYIAGRGLQSAELNEVQEITLDKLKALGDTFYTNGQVLKGGELTVLNNALYVAAATVYVKGSVRSVAAQTFSLDPSVDYELGVLYSETVITSDEDEDLLDPAVGTRNWNQPGAARLKVSVEWALKREGQQLASGVEFLSYKKIKEGVVEEAPSTGSNNGITGGASGVGSSPDLSGMLADYDYERFGSYIQEGVKASCQAVQNFTETFLVTKGVARIQGQRVTFNSDKLVSLTVTPQTLRAVNEPHDYNPEEDQTSQRILFDRPTCAHVEMVSITRQKTKTLTHGGYSGAADDITDTSVLSIVAITQDETTFEQGKDYRLDRGRVEWIQGQNEPAPGSTYQIVYRAQVQLNEADLEAIDSEGCTISQAVPGTPVLITYTWYVPRIDLLALHPEKGLLMIEGQSHEWTLSKPSCPEGVLPLAYVYQTWDGSVPSLEEAAVRCISYADLEKLKDEVEDLRYLLLLERLQNSAAATDPAAKKELLVDSFQNEHIRDKGLEQTAAIDTEAGVLRLAYKEVASPLSLNENKVLLDYEEVALITQPYATGTMNVNEYGAFDPIPAVIKLSPSVDSWVVSSSSLPSSTTALFTGSGSYSSISMRQTVVSYEGTGFEAGEKVTIQFANVYVEGSNNTASPQGTIKGTFQVPAGMPSGTVEVSFIGDQGTLGRARYTAEPTIVTTTRRSLGSTSRRDDPLAQTFTLPETRIITGVELYFKTKGTKPVVIQVRRAQLGVPTNEWVAEGVLTAQEISITGATRCAFSPFICEAGTEYALVVMTDDSQYTLAIAELGKYAQEAGMYVTAQPYQTGVLLSSSNASTWTSHQEMDLKFKLLGAQFTRTEADIELKRGITLADITDFKVLGNVERPGKADVAFVLVDEAGHEYTAPEGSLVTLSSKKTGTYKLLARMRGTETLAPILYENLQLLLGEVQEEGTYITRAIEAPGAQKITVIMEVKHPGNSKCEVEYNTNTNPVYQALPFKSGTKVDSVKDEMTYSIDGLTGGTYHIRLKLVGNAANRPEVSNLRVILT